MNTEPKTMTAEEMQDYFQKIGRAELYEEIESMKSDNNEISSVSCSKTVSVYLKAIRVSLIALGYNSLWVNTTFRDAMLQYFFQDAFKNNNKN